MSPARRSYDVASVERAEVLRYLGYAGQPLTSELDARIDEVVASCLAACRPCGVTRVFDVAGTGEKDGAPVIELAGTALALRGHSIAEHLDGAVAVGVLAVTVGMGVEAELRRLSLTDRVAQVIFDARARPPWSARRTRRRRTWWPRRRRAGSSAGRASRRATGTCHWRRSRCC